MKKVYNAKEFKLWPHPFVVNHLPRIPDNASVSVADLNLTEAQQFCCHLIEQQEKVSNKFLKLVDKIKDELYHGRDFRCN